VSAVTPSFDERLRELKDRGPAVAGSLPPLVRVSGAARSYGEGSAARVALRQTNCEISDGDRIALMGPSGSGKSTLLHLMAGLDLPTVGTVDWPGIGLRESLRPGPVAIVFQGPSLLPALSVVENVALPLIFGGQSNDEATARADRALAQLELSELRDKLPEEISGGQAQRVAVGRALAGEPRLILADEPTGQLDREIGSHVVDLLIAAADHADAALVISTHDPAIGARLPTRWQLADGELLVSTNDDSKETSR
jgi:putative ABC transport system ATP-binding protein/lipoprotein-releasing system ATP-binding protein